ncbi:hypothetical protein B0H66DRAFT_486618 [Apodospora peruviana]|uniref:TauD/TfdA-like domain-containing protein n=1 Tax=Apodospora peruviana TaxID=516989 RepID=A0AAE0LY47_9PEZI|nr:hypothetical protein B0H66DRAFT_486618 [Apodospora peruviana]
MDFSGKDLADIQRVAGLLNLTVDELLQQRRRPSEANRQGALGHIYSPLILGAASPYITVPAQNENNQDSPLTWSDSHNNGSVDLDRLEAEEQRLSIVTIGTAASATSDIVEGLDNERVILLNPQSVWYDCDAAVLDFDDSAEYFNMDHTSPAEGDGADAYVAVTPMQVDSEAGSECTARDGSQGKETDGVETDWSIVPSSPGSLSSFQTPISPSTGSTDRRYHLIAPKSAKTGSQSVSEASSHRVRKKRSPYQGTKKTDTHLTRQVHACVRCRMQRNRCIPDPTNPRGPCVTCQLKTVRMSRLPCLRYMVTDSTLFRTGLDYMPFYKSHPMIGPHYGDFHLERYWTGAPSKTLCLGQLGALNFKVELQEFVPPATSDVDLKGRSMYAVPWAIADPDAVVSAINDYIDRGMTQYLYGYLDDTDTLVWDIFQAAYRASVFPTPNRMLQKTLRLWVACRFIESKWRCWGDSGWADDSIRAANPRDPFYDFDSPPPYLDYQLASIIIHRVLSPLRKDVLRDLQSTLNTHSPKDWYVTFLASFILLQNYEMQMQFQRQFAARRKAEIQYLDMPLQLFSEGFDWTAPRVRRMARLDAEQTNFMAQCRDRVVKKDHLPTVSSLGILIVNSISITMGIETVLPRGGEQKWHNLQLKMGTQAAQNPVSNEWPTEMKGDLCWDSTNFKSDDDYILTLSDNEVSEVKAALQHFNSLGLFGSEVSAGNFPLPTLGSKLLRAAVDVHRGKGFTVVRGLRPAEFTPEENALIFLGISSYIGAKRGRQDEDGNMLMHIRDAKLSKAAQHDRPTRYSSRASTFHTDTFCDILALQTRTCAAEGGRNILTSSWTVYNKVMALAPELRELLAQPIWPFDTRGRLFECSTRPLLYYHGGRILLNFAREPLLGLAGVRRTAGLATLTPEQRLALDLVEEIAKDSQVVVDAEPGDMIFINNHAVLHSREAFADAPSASRYLVRMWLKNSTMAWKLPRALQEGNSRIYDDNELGERWNITDTPKIQFRLSERLTS